MRVRDYLEAKTASVFGLFEKDIERDFDEVSLGNYAYIKGDIPICLVAHIDTVRNEQEPILVLEKNGVMYAKNSVLGADDRAGVYALAHLYKTAENGKKPSILLTDKEETGGIGVKAFCKEYKKLPFDCNLFIALDQTEATDYIIFRYLRNEVTNYIESFGFFQAFRDGSDIEDLTNAYEIPSANLSIGYYHQHTKNEFLVIDIMMATIKRVARMLQNPIDKLYPPFCFAILPPVDITIGAPIPPPSHNFIDLSH